MGSRQWSSPSPACPTEPRGVNSPVRKSEGQTGTHVIGRLDTYRALEQHVLEGKVLARELMCLTRPALCPLPAKEVMRGQDRADGGWGMDAALGTLHKGAPEPTISLEPFRAGMWQGAPTPRAVAGTALLC